jgi:serralysin
MDGGPGNDVAIGDNPQGPPPFSPVGSNDTMFGGPGNDGLFGLGGNDTINGGDGIDDIIGFGGNDRLTGGPGGDNMFGGPGQDYMAGDAGNDLMFGNFGSDTMLGGDGNDEIDGDNPSPPPPEGLPFDPGTNNDSCLGQAGSDQIFNCERGDPSTPRDPPFGGPPPNG